MAAERSSVCSLRLLKRMVRKITVKKFVRFETGEGIEKEGRELCRGSCKADGTVVLIFKKCPKRRNRKVSGVFASMC